jgi:hypothetical protein
VRCREAPAEHPRVHGYYVPSGRCRLHGGVSTGPRTPEGKAVISAAARRRWAAVLEAEGKVRPFEALRARVSAFLDDCTWEQAMRATGLSRRTLLRVERGGYCHQSELSTVRRVLEISEAEPGVGLRQA